MSTEAYGAASEAWRAALNGSGYVGSATERYEQEEAALRAAVDAAFAASPGGAAAPSEDALTMALKILGPAAQEIWRIDDVRRAVEAVEQAMVQKIVERLREIAAEAERGGNHSAEDYFTSAADAVEDEFEFGASSGSGGGTR